MDPSPAALTFDAAVKPPWFVVDTEMDVAPHALIELVFGLATAFIAVFVAELARYKFGHRN
ncbi:hypothetical protein K491DRAFT_693985 [Lophiostoma macrostomum CBS 122681]|uniref:Uncharacterized protein n=1 Tax=Lophiostoma macrostomum CBS 122681 TaxID=1314788 RepID=A0A6A6T2P5_9PLEO|nr:hypothetical protein K491DRAFT_693985 [Lophiostoma macrostomum CBS 122681]